MPSRRDLLGERIARHGLVDRAAQTTAHAAALTCAIQAQDAQASRLGIRVRAAGSTDQSVLTAIGDSREVARTWLMRGTIHLVDTADLRWLVRLIGPALIRKFATRWRQLGLDDDVLAASAAALLVILADGPLTRGQVRDALAQRGVRIDSPDPQAHTHVLLNASALGLVCRGPERGRDATFTLIDQWLPEAPAGPSGDDALAELARRYFAAFSPATASDFTTWSGLGAGQAVALIRDELTPADVDGRAGFRLGEVAPARGLQLLPAFDNYLLGYRHRDAILHESLRPRVYNGGLICASVVLDGRVVGIWTLQRAQGQLTVHPFETLSRASLRGVDAEVADIARFLDRELTVEIAAPLA